MWNKVTAHILPHTLVFPFSRQWGSELFHRAASKAGIELQPRQGIHSLRHSIAHHMLDRGAPLPVVQKALRHTSIGSTGCYLEADGRDVDQWRAKAIAPASGTYVAVQAAGSRSLRYRRRSSGSPNSRPRCRARQNRPKGSTRRRSEGIWPG